MYTDIEEQYSQLLNHVKLYGHQVDNDRTGVGTKKDFGHLIKLDVEEVGFPILTSKFVHFKSIVVELLWMLNGDDNTDYLKEHGVTIWDEWADDNGDLNGVYGKQWRHWHRNVYKREVKSLEDLCDMFGRPEEFTGHTAIFKNGQTWNYFNKENFFRWDQSIDQVEQLINTIKTNPNDRRQIVTAWNVDALDSMNLPPCHHTWQTFVRGDTLDLMMHQRSCDMFLGVPFNLTAYSLLLCILAKITGLKPGKFTWTGGDCHVYSNHVNQVDKYLDNYYTNASSNGGIQYPTLCFNDDIDFSSLQSFLDTTLDNPERIFLMDYKHMGSIKADVAV